jgi:hypothetical protein
MSQPALLADRFELFQRPLCSLRQPARQGCGTVVQPSRVFNHPRSFLVLGEMH